MERRLSVHAGGNSQALIRGGRRRAWVIGLVLVSLASAADARPKRRDARTAFEQGVAAYKKGDFEAASASFSKSYDLEGDAETLFAWAQSERLLQHCDKAIELYERLLGLKLPAKNREAVEQHLDACRTIIAQQKPPVAPPTVAAPAASTPAEPTPRPSAQAEPPRVAEHVEASPAPAPQVDTGPASSAWYKDPITVGLLGGGLVASGVGAGFLLSARSIGRDAKDMSAAGGNFFAVEDLNAKAESRGTIGLIATGAGGALLIGGVVWMVMHRDDQERATVTGWLAPDGGGLAVAGPF